jgi:hypothetical protein
LTILKKIFLQLELLLQIHGDFPLILNYLENYINNTLIMNWSRSSYQCSANSDESKQMSEDELIFLDIGLYELHKMTIISDIEHITVNSNFNCSIFSFLLIFHYFI